MSILEGVTLEFEEFMSGFIGVGESDPRKGAAMGRNKGTAMEFHVRIKITDLNRFLREPAHEAELSGTVRCDPLGGPSPIRDGRFNLFSLDPATGMRQMVYSFRFTSDDGQGYFLHGHKEVHDDPGKVDVVEDMTRLFTTLYRGETDQSPVYAAGELYFKLSDAPSLMASIRVSEDVSFWRKAAAYAAFTSFAYGALRDVYLTEVLPFYDTRYENLVLSGLLKGREGPKPFFLVSGEHDKGFPWGDGETFWDVLLAVEDGKGDYHRYCITDRFLDGLDLEVAQGTYRYHGPLFALTTGHSASFSQMQREEPKLLRCDADIHIVFDAKPHETVSFPFPVQNQLVRKVTRTMARKFQEIFPSEHPFGIHITPHSVFVRSGKVSIEPQEGNADAPSMKAELEVDSDQTFGEAECSIFRNIKEPTMLYHYICALRPAQQASRVQIHSRTLRDEREHWAKDQLDAFLGTLVSRAASAEYLMEKGRLNLRALGRQGEEAAKGSLIAKQGEPVLEVNNDHYPTAVFQRRIVKVLDPSSEKCLALEENMDLMRLEAIGSERKVTVAAIQDDHSKFAALDKVLEETGFEQVLANRLAAVGKTREDFTIVIKPNFMFAYNKLDRTTFTDPELVGHLVRHLRAAGFKKISVVEAQSTYGEYFDKRSVREVADYLGFDGKAGYQVVDMTEDAVETKQFGPHLGLHPVSAAWRDADFRISFAKNKTHAYSYYTLTLKNIYGALPMANKFKEYHCERDIYHTTMEYLTAFPVHFGLVDAYLSADGPFGIFSDTRPNQTHTIIGGADLVAVDWVAATKMGIDPMISPYMRLAVQSFGKPEIKLVGDGNPYQPWLNVPVALTLFTHKGLDANFHFGNLFYSAAAQMDETHFHHKARALHIRVLRKLTVPIRRMFFVRTGEKPSLGNRIASWFLYRLGF